MSLWDHQLRGLEQVNAAIAGGDSAIVVTSPTGGGKSRMMFELVKGLTGSVHIHTDRRMLMAQLSRNMEEAGIDHGLIASGYEGKIARVQLAMIQTVVSQSIKRGRLLGSPDVTIWDEVHKNVGPYANELRARYEAPVDIGFTATPLGLGGVYETLIVAGTNSELRKAGHIVPAYHYAPNEPDMKWIGKVDVSGGECGISDKRRREYCHQVFASVVNEWRSLNFDETPTVLFAPDVAGSVWFAQELTKQGIPSAHIDGTDVWLDGRVQKRTEELTEEIRIRTEGGDIKVVCNRFVLREGIDWPFIEHVIFATVFGSLTSYLQAGGRGLRASQGKERVIVQDHGGNWWRHGSLNADRDWHIRHTDRIVQAIRQDRMRQGKEPQPIICPKCKAARMDGAWCTMCGYRYRKKMRRVLQKDGSLREVVGEVYRKKRYLDHEEGLERKWNARVKSCRDSKKESVRSMTIAQIEANFARERNWRWPLRFWRGMPVHEMDFFLPVHEVKEFR